MATVEELAVRFKSQLSQLQSIFPSWDQGDLVFTLQDARGNVDEAAMMITEGRAAQFTQASRKKPAKPVKEVSKGKGHSNQNADSGGWEQVNGDSSDFRAARGGRGGRGGARGGRGGRGGEPFRGGRGGRGGGRGGRGGFANVNGGANGIKKNGDSATDAWTNQVEQATEAATANGVYGTSAAETGEAKSADQNGWAESATAPVETGKGDDFAATNGWGDAPAAKEVEKAARTVNAGKKEDIKNIAPSAQPPPAKPKLTWAQIAKPVEKPKPVPVPVQAPAPPAPEPESKAEVTTVEPTNEETDVPAEATEETPAEPVESWGDAPAPAEVEAEAAALNEQVEETYANGQEEVLPEETAEGSQDWSLDPAIAGIGSQPQWAKTIEQPVPIAPEPVTTYTGPPGFNIVAARTAAAQQPRTSSRAGRYKDADGKGVVLPAMASGVSAMEMQFGSLSFGGEAGDGVEAPEPKAEPTPATPAQPLAAPAPPTVTSPVRAPAPPSTQPFQTPVAAIPPSVAQPAAAPSTHPYYSQQPAQPPAQSAYTAPHQTLQAQMQHSYQSHFLPQSAAQPQPTQLPQAQQQQSPAQQQAPSHDQAQQGFYRSSDYYNIGSQAHQQHQQPEALSQQQAPQQAQPSQQQQQQQQPQQSGPQHQAPHASSPYDAPFAQFGQSHLFGQQAQQGQANDPFGQAQRYDSYSASGYPRPSVEEAKAAAPAPSHTPTAPSQPQQQGVPQHQNQYYSQLNNMGYYQASPYNPYYQYGQAPQAGFQQYYPLAGRNLYGQPNPQAQPPQPIPQANKPTPPAAQSPYGAPSSYPSSAYDEQTFGLGRYGEQAKPQAPSAAGQGPAPVTQPSNPAQQSYQSQGQGLHGFLGINTPSATSAGSRPQATTPDEGFKPTTSAASRPQQSGQQPAQQAFGNYQYGNGYGQDWSQYGYGRNGYAGWQG
ncbi:hypothetical protein BCR39DRAFT_545589 [Naematelia encephala]|uniref:CUE domain-containing protein n=1 Tax=Naematelia encephala TaxID=71784 RepID=A0A1Y2AQX0_9TREE|nr:hypothetical protein BCR39DRAFT_545589 [Naematelia encephala]